MSLQVDLLLKQAEISDNALDLDDLVLESLEHLLTVLDLRDVLGLRVGCLLIGDIKVIEVHLQLREDVVSVLRVHLQLLSRLHQVRKQLLICHSKLGDLSLECGVLFLIAFGIMLVLLILDLVLLILVLDLLEGPLHPLQLLIQVVQLLLERFWRWPTRVDFR